MHREKRAGRSIDDCVGESTSSSAVLVRLLPDYAGTVLWCPHPVAYAATQLDPNLVADLIYGWLDPRMRG